LLALGQEGNSYNGIKWSLPSNNSSDAEDSSDEVIGF